MYICEQMGKRGGVMFSLFCVTIILSSRRVFVVCHPGVFVLQCSPPHVSGKIFLGTYLFKFFFFSVPEIVTTVPLAVTFESFGTPLSLCFFPKNTMLQCPD